MIGKNKKAENVEPKAKPTPKEDKKFMKLTTGNGALFENQRKEKQNQPDFRGHGVFGDKYFWISGWSRFTVTTGEEYISFSITEMDEEYTKVYKDRDKEREEKRASSSTSSTSSSTSSVKKEEEAPEVDEDIPF